MSVAQTVKMSNPSENVALVSKPEGKLVFLDNVFIETLVHNSAFSASSNNEQPKTTANPKPVIKRDVWGNQIEFLLASIGYCIGIGNVWR